MKSLWSLLLLMTLAGPARATSLGPLFAIGFQDSDDPASGCSPVTAQMETDLLAARDGQWAPHPEGCLPNDWFGTGSSAQSLDGISAHFHLPPGLDHDLVLRVYLERGDQSDTEPAKPAAHALKVYPGLMSAAEEDCDWPSCGAPADEFPAGRHWEGWVEREIPASWIQSGVILELTIRLWDARVDAIEIVQGSLTPTRPTRWGELKLLYR